MSAAASQIRVPAQALLEDGYGLAARGTNGSNPWVDSVFYEAQWASPLAIAFNHETPVYSYYFLEPNDLANPDLQFALSSKLSRWQGNGATSGVAAYSEELKNTYRNAYQAWADVCNLVFAEAKSAETAAILNANAYFNNEGWSGWGRTRGSHQGLVDTRNLTVASTPLIQDINAYWVQEEDSLSRGSAVFSTAVHEIGHGIGLSHPHDSGIGFATSGVFPGLAVGDAEGMFGTGLYGLNQRILTVMSYKGGYTSRYLDDSKELQQRREATPMALDVAAAQIKYGTNRNTRTNDNQYTLNPDVWECLYDAGGTDWIDARNAERRGHVQPGTSAHINLRPAEMNAIRPDTGLPMEQYSFADYGLSANQNLATNTLISLQTSGIGSPLGMGYVFAGKLARVLETEETRQSFLSQNAATLENLGISLRSMPPEVNPLQIVTALRQSWWPAYEQLDNPDLPRIINLLNANGARLNDQNQYTLVSLMRYSTILGSVTDDMYVSSFADSPTSGPESMASHIARLEEEQQAILARSAQGIAGYANFFEGHNGGFTIAAGVSIENARGGYGDDIITGNAGSNRLVGNRGDDILEGYFGADIMSGGKGHDVFVYANNADSLVAKHDRDVITDFTRDDKISLKPLKDSINAAIDPQTRSIQDEFTFDFIGSQSFSGIPGEVRFSRGSLRIDLTGNGHEDMRIDFVGFDNFTKSNLIL